MTCNMNRTTMIAMVALFVSIQYFIPASADCYRMAGCKNPRTGKRHKEGDRFSVIDKNQMSCSGCMCTKNRRYVASCMILKVVNVTRPIRKAGLYRRIADPSRERMSATFANDVEMELSEKEASVVQCEPEYVPSYNSNRQLLEFHFIHYFFTTYETVCCRKTPAYGNVHPYCTVRFDAKCRTRAVMRDFPNRSCKMPFSLRG